MFFNISKSLRSLRKGFFQICSTKLHRKQYNRIPNETHVRCSL